LTSVLKDFPIIVKKHKRERKAMNASVIIVGDELEACVSACDIRYQILLFLLSHFLFKPIFQAVIMNVSD
jgi:hypothetical protein